MARLTSKMANWCNAILNANLATWLVPLYHVVRNPLLSLAENHTTRLYCSLILLTILNTFLSIKFRKIHTLSSRYLHCEYCPLRATRDSSIESSVRELTEKKFLSYIRKRDKNTLCNIRKIAKNLQNWTGTYENVQNIFYSQVSNFQMRIESNPTLHWYYFVVLCHCSIKFALSLD